MLSPLRVLTQTDVAQPYWWADPRVSARHRRHHHSIYTIYSSTPNFCYQFHVQSPLLLLFLPSYMASLINILVLLAFVKRSKQALLSSNAIMHFDVPTLPFLRSKFRCSLRVEVRSRIMGTEARYIISQCDLKASLANTPILIKFALH